jgi:AraC family L-rhamnose operon transcriptional activator RhaR
MATDGIIRRALDMSESTSATPVPSFSARRRFVDLNQLALRLPIGRFRCEILGWGLLGERWWRNYMHAHSFFEVCCAFGGEGIFRLNGREHVVRRGDVFVARPGDLHEIVPSEADPLAIHFWSFLLSEETDADAENSNDADPDADALLRAFVRSPRWHSAETDALQTTLLLLTEEIAAHAPGFRRAIDGLATKLILDTARAVTPHGHVAIDAPARSDDMNRSLSLRIERYLQDNYVRPITMRDVAAQVNLSERHAARIFRRTYGTTIKECVTSLRIEEASRRLIASQEAIKSIAADCGFPDVQHFTTVFRRHTGLTPAAFRRQRGTRFADPSLPGHVEPSARPI